MHELAMYLHNHNHNSREVFCHVETLFFFPRVKQRPSLLAHFRPQPVLLFSQLLLPVNFPKSWNSGSEFRETGAWIVYNLANQVHNNDFLFIYYLKGIKCINFKLIKFHVVTNNKILSV